jgi:hypothetical protein
MKELRERVKTQYWIDRSGKCHYFEGSEEEAEEITSLHYEIVARLFPEIKFPNNPEHYVEKLGWIKVGSWCYHQPVCLKAPNQKQKAKLIERGWKIEQVMILER